MISELIKNNTTAQQRVLMANKLKSIKAVFSRGNLNKLATIHGSDKWGAHWYTQHYNFHFAAIRKRKMKVFEIGVGGYDSPYMGGNSLRMWKDYFPNSRIYSLDIYDKSPLNEPRITIFKGSQDDEQILSKINQQHGPFDIIIDDGSHINHHVIKSFEVLFPLLKDGGIYAIEDTQTSYLESFGGDAVNLNNNSTMMNFFMNMIHGINYIEYKPKDYQPSYYEEYINSIHFYHNLVIIHKRKNTEHSNLK